MITPCPTSLTTDLDSGHTLTLAQVEESMIRAAVVFYAGAGGMSAVAKRLGISRSTLYRKMRLYAIPMPLAAISAERERTQNLRHKVRANEQGYVRRTGRIATEELV